MALPRPVETTDVPKLRAEHRLAALGFKTAASRVAELAELKKKMMIAYEHFRFVKPKNVAEFQAKLYATSRQKNGDYKVLSFTPVSDYEEVPPEHVLTSLESAIDKKCFDAFEVAHIRTVKDPILFGKINGCPDYFFIDQWDDDVKISDLLKENEG